MHMHEHRLDTPALDLAKEVASSLRRYFGDRVTALAISNVIDDRNHVEFSVLFEAYSFFPVIFNYDRGFFGFGIVYGDRAVGVEPLGGHWASFGEFRRVLEQLDEELRLRIPDKYLDAKGWVGRSGH